MFKKIKLKLALFFAVFGPGVIAAIADNDAGGVGTYSIVGAEFGYSMLFILFAVTFLLAVTQEIGARIAIVSGKGLGDLIREHYGIRTALFIFSLLFLANMGSIVANFAGIAAGLQLFQVPVLPFQIVFLFLIVLFIAIGNYQTNQKIFLVMSFMFVAYIASAIMAKPDWGLALKSLVIPTNIKWTPAFVFAAMALLGTTVTPWGQFFIASFVNDKKLSKDHLRFEQIEVWAGAFITDFFAFFMVVAVAATLYKNGISINSPEEAALAIAPFAGDFAKVLFGLGLLAASYMGAVIIPLTTAYAFSEFFGTEGSLDIPFTKSSTFYGIFLLQVTLAFFIVMLPYFSLFKIVLITQSINALLLPVVFFFLIRFANNKNIMGKHTNTRAYNWFTVLSGVTIAIAGVFVIVGGLLGYV